MTTQKVKRKLTAIMSADVEGYGRLMGEDEVSTVQTLTGYREVMSSLIEQHRGRVVDSPGDNLLAEFGSVVDAVQCAVEIQEVLKAKNEELSDNRKMMFRIGINLGDVIEEGDRIYGDGVNIAARLESLAEAGGICISGSAHEQIKNKLALGYEYIGEHSVKNIAEPLKVYRVPTGPKAGIPKEGKEKKVELKKWQWPALGVVVVLVLVVGAVAIWNFYFRPPKVEPASVARMAFPLPEEPSIAVLPFNNMSGDPKQGYFSDGMTESIITALSKIPGMFVIARHSTFTYKGKAVKVQRVAEELGVRYVLEGSVQRSENRIRITAQLIDALTGRHIWAERYDRELKDIFALQDDVIRNIVTALEVKLTEGEQARLWRGQTTNDEAYEYFVRGGDLARHLTKADNAESRRLMEKALALDPGFAAAWIGVARTLQLDVQFGWAADRRQTLAHAREYVQKSLALDDTQAESYAVMSRIALIAGQHEQALAHCNKALSLNPGSLALAQCGLSLMFLGRPEESLELVKRAMRLSPYYRPFYLFVLGNAHRLLGQYDEAIDALKRQAELIPPPGPFGHANLAHIYMQAGREEDARAAAAEVLKRVPNFTLKRFKNSLHYRDPSETERILANLRKAGLPD